MRRVPSTIYERAPLPWEAGFLAGKCFLAYRRRGGVRNTPLPDLYIGAHAAIEKLALLTRDVARYQTYFPESPDNRPVEGLAPLNQFVRFPQEVATPLSYTA